MSDDVAKAIALNKTLAARHLMRRDELEAELATLKEAGPSPALDARLAELAEVEGGYRAALAEIRDLEKLARTPALVLATDDTAPFERTAEDQALENVRDHIGSLDAQARVAEELRPTPPPAKASREDAEAQARAEFEELRNKRPETPVTGRPKKTL
jgi:hypothetical protein